MDSDIPRLKCTKPLITTTKYYLDIIFSKHIAESRECSVPDAAPIPIPIPREIYTILQDCSKSRSSRRLAPQDKASTLSENGPAKTLSLIKNTL